MKPLRLLTSILAAGVLPLFAEDPLEPLDGQQEYLRAWAIEDFHAVTSADERVRVTVVVETAGHTHNSRRLVATITDDAPVEGDSLHTTTFEFGRVNCLESPVRLEKVNDRLYRFAYDASVSDTFESAVLNFTYDLHLAEDGHLTRVVPVLAFSSFWDMDGSKMGLVASGPHRSIYYVEPKAGSKVAPGALFFNGTPTGKTYRGKVLNGCWEKGSRLPVQSDFAPVAEGEIQDEGRTVALKSQQVEWKNGENVPVGPKQTHILRFKSVAGPAR